MSQADAPRPAPLEPVRVLSVPEGIPICVRFLGPILGLDTHWKNGTKPCPGEDECPPTIHRLGIIWRGYAPVESWENSRQVWRPWVLEVTEALEETLRGRQLRGETWLLERTREKGRTAAVIGVYCEAMLPDDVRPGFDVEPVLRRIFHCGKLRLGTRNPVPAKVMLEVMPGKPPVLPGEQAQPERVEEDNEKRQQALELMRKFYKRHGMTSPNGQESKNGQVH